MNNNTIREILKNKTMVFTRAEIEEMMDEELEKDVDEMDTELITLCLEALTGEKFSDNGGAAEKETSDAAPIKSNKTTLRKNKTIKIILVAAILISLMLLSVSVGADVMNIDVSDKILEAYDGFFKVDLNGEVKVTDLKNLLYENELEHLVLPKCLYEGFEVTDFEKVDGEESVRVTFSFASVNGEMKGGFTCSIYESTKNFANGKQNVDDANKNFKKLVCNGINILVFSGKTNSTITYINKNIEYKISLVDTNLKNAVKIAETI